MKIVYTRHAKNRMRWRAITASEVEETLASPEKIIQESSRKFHFCKAIGAKYIRVTAAREENQTVIISVVDKNE